jgi:hypothetical protein
VQETACIVTCHDYARYLPECLDSILAQSLPFAHVIVVDDASTDNTPAVCKRYARRGVRTLRTEFRDVALARNAGVDALPRTPFLLFVDADNVLPEDYHELLAKRLEGDWQCGAAYGHLWYIDDRGQKGQLSPHVREYDFEALRRQNFADTCALIRREAFDLAGRWQSNPFGLQDWQLWLRITAHGWRMAWAPEAMLRYRIHDQRMSRARAGNFRCHQEAVAAAQTLALVTIWSGREWSLPIRERWLQALEWPKESIHLVAVDNSGSPAFGKKLKRHLADSGCAFTYLQDTQRAVAGVASHRLAASAEERTQHAHAMAQHLARLYGRAQAALPTGADLVFSVEDDIEPSADVLAPLCEGLQRNASAAAVAAVVRSRFVPGRVIAWECLSVPMAIRWAGSAPAPGKLKPVVGSHFGCTLFRREAFDKIVFRPSIDWSLEHAAYDWAAAYDLALEGYTWWLAGADCRHWNGPEEWV